MYNEVNMTRRTLVGISLVAMLVMVLLLLVKEAAAPSAPKVTAPTKSAPRTTQPKATTFDKTQFSTTDPSSPWVVVNKQHPLSPIDYTPNDLMPVGNGQQMRAEAATALKTMFSDAQAGGYTLVADSGYRSYSTQVSTYNSEVKAYGQAKADSESARPGYSEHQTGWAVDIGADGCHVADCFGDLPAGQWVQANSYKYGFIWRYTSDNTDVTGYRAEAWHFRYIGAALAAEMHKEGITTLEQFFNISGGPNYN